MAPLSGHCTLPRKSLHVQPAISTENSHSIWKAFRQPRHGQEQERRRIHSMEEYPALGQLSISSEQEASSSGSQEQPNSVHAEEATQVSQVEETSHGHLPEPLSQSEEFPALGHPCEVLHAEQSSYQQQQQQTSPVQVSWDAGTCSSEYTVTPQTNKLPSRRRTRVLGETIKTMGVHTLATPTPVYHGQGIHLNEKFRMVEKERAAMPPYTLTRPISQQMFPQAQASTSGSFTQEASSPAQPTQSSNTASTRSRNFSPLLQGSSPVRYLNDREQQRIILGPLGERLSCSLALEMGNLEGLNTSVPTPRAERSVFNIANHQSSSQTPSQLPIRVPAPHELWASRVSSWMVGLEEATLPLYDDRAQQESERIAEGVATRREREGTLSPDIHENAHLIVPPMPRREISFSGQNSNRHAPPSRNLGLGDGSRAIQVPTSIAGSNNQASSGPTPAPFQPPNHPPSSLISIPALGGLGVLKVSGRIPSAPGAGASANSQNLPWPISAPFAIACGLNNQSSHRKRPYPTGPGALWNTPPFPQGSKEALLRQGIDFGISTHGVPSSQKNTTASQYHDISRQSSTYGSYGHSRLPLGTENQLKEEGVRTEGGNLKSTASAEHQFLVEGRSRASHLPNYFAHQSIVNHFGFVQKPIPSRENPKTALFVLWPQEGFAEDFSEGQISRLNNFIRRANENSIPVFYNTTAMGNEMKYSFSTNKLLEVFKMLAAKHDSKSGIIPALEPSQFGAFVLHTNRVGQFPHNDFARELWRKGIRTLVLTGLGAGMLSALHRVCPFGFQLVIIEDLCAEPDAEVHRALMRDFFQKQAEVLRSDAWNYREFWTPSRLTQRMMNGAQ